MTGRIPALPPCIEFDLRASTCPPLAEIIPPAAGGVAGRISPPPPIFIIKYMPASKVIIISGPPCTGKTTFAKRVSKNFGLPIVCCDPIRELLYDAFGCFDLAIFRKNRKVSFALMYNVFELLLRCKQPLIVDSTFWSKENRVKILKLQSQYKFKCLQFNLRACGQVLWGRYEEKMLSRHRHPGYLDRLRQKELRRKIIKGFSIPPKIRGRTIKVDTTDLKKVDYKGLLKTIKNFLKT